MTASVGLAIGQRLRSQVCETEVMVVRVAGPIPAPDCGGHPMVAGTDAADPALTLDVAWSAGSRLGKRYVVEGFDLELLVVRSGAGSLGVAGRSMTEKSAKPLPSSD